jgi:hypothetical protein
VTRVGFAHDLGCVVHLHSLYSDGTGTVAEIAKAARRSGAEVVLLTDHDTLEARDRGEEGWHDGVLVCVGEEVSPKGHNHYLAFGVDRLVDHAGLDCQGIVDAVAAAGGFGFPAHPFSTGSPRFRRASGIPWEDLACIGYTGIELWSAVTDSAEKVRKLTDVGRFIVAPDRFLDHPPAANLAGWDALCAERRVVAIGGVDAHQIGKRIAGRVPLRLMAYHRSFRLLRTRVLLENALSGDTERDREAVYAALRAGRCYLARDSLAPARDFSFWADGPRRLEMGEENGHAKGLTVHVRTPRPARIALLRDGQEVATREGEALDHPAEQPGVYRVEATVTAHGRQRTWILSNPIYLR